MGWQRQIAESSGRDLAGHTTWVMTWQIGGADYASRRDVWEKAMRQMDVRMLVNKGRSIVHLVVDHNVQILPPI